MCIENKPNVIEIGGGFYIVRTQAGFRQLAKKYDVYSDDEWTSLSDVLRGFPASYPAVVSMSNGYEGCITVQVNSVHVNTMKEALEGE